MSKSRTVEKENFTLKKARISENGVESTFEEKRVVDGQAQIIQHFVKANYTPHPDIIKKMKKLREYLVQAYHLDQGFNLALKYLRGDQKTKVQEKLIELYDMVETTGISIGGDEQLRGVVISGKILSFNKSKSAMNTPRIVFSSDKLGIEQEVEELINEIENEVFAYLFENKKAQSDLFDESEKIQATSTKKEKVNQAEEVPSGLE